MEKKNKNVQHIELPLDQMIPEDREYFVEQDVNPAKQNVNMKGRPVGNPPTYNEAEVTVVDGIKSKNQEEEIQRQVKMNEPDIELVNEVKDGEGDNVIKGEGNTNIVITDREMADANSTPVNFTTKTYDEMVIVGPDIKTFPNRDESEEVKKTTDDKETNETHTTQK